MFEKGGGKRATYNYVDACVDFSRLSRFVVQVFVPYGNLFSPLAAFLPGATLPTSTSFLFLKPETLVIALQPMCGQRLVAEKDLLPAGPGLAMFKPIRELWELFRKAEQYEKEFCSVVQWLEGEARKRGKRKATLTEIAPEPKRAK